jgi:hypothetical protein
MVRGTRGEDLEETEAGGRKAIGRPSKAEPFRQFVSGHLAADRHLTTSELLRLARSAGYQGRKSAFYDLVRSLRPDRASAILPPEAWPGEVTRHGFGAARVRFTTGQRRVEFLATRLEYSDWVEVSLIGDRRVATLCRTLMEHYGRLGGVPLLAVLELPVARVVATDHGGVPRFDPTFARTALGLGLGVEIAERRRGQGKGRRSDLSALLRTTFFRARSFADDADLERQLAEWVVERNTRLVSRSTGKVPLEAKQQEEPRLRPLRFLAADILRTSTP